MIPLEDRFTGSLLGLALGDALGARHEGGPLGQAAWWVLGLGGGGALRWSDDTEMAVGPAKSLVEHRGLDPDALARSWAEGADWKRGYGPARGGYWPGSATARIGAWRTGPSFPTDRCASGFPAPDVPLPRGEWNGVTPSA